MQHNPEADRNHRELTARRLSSEGRKYFQFIEFDADEELISEIRKDPFGLFLIFLTGSLVFLTIAGFTAFLLAFDADKFIGGHGANSFKPLLVLVSLILLVGSIVGMLIGAFLYRSNVIFITSEKIAQVVYTSLFHRKISQLSIGDVQDVTVSQNGILAHMFNYGTLVIETAGEQQNYTFSFVPDPYKESTLIVGAHERNLVQYGN